EPVGVRGRVAGFVDAVVDDASHMLDKGTEHAVADGSDGEIPAENDRCLFHVAATPSFLIVILSDRMSRCPARNTAAPAHRPPRAERGKAPRPPASRRIRWTFGRRTSPARRKASASRSNWSA